MRDIASRFGHRLHSWCASEVPWLARGSQDPSFREIVTWHGAGPDACDRFHHRYGEALTCFDAVIVDHPIWFAALFERLDRPVIANVTTRYELGVTHSPERWQWLDGTLRRMRDRGQLMPVSNNRADREYSREHLGFDWPMTPSLCEYTGIKYVGDRPGWLLAALERPPLPSPYPWTDLGRYRGIRHVPYNASLMSFTEHYAAAIPLAVPSPERLLQMALDDELDAMAQVSLFRYGGLPPGEGLNDYRSRDVLATWISRCDWYNEEWMPHVIVTDAPPESQSLDLAAISARMAAFNVIRRDRILASWRETLGRIPLR